MKKSLLFLILGIFLISFASAQFLGGFYGNFLDSSIIVWGAIFVIFFAFINFLLGRTIFKQDNTTRLVIALAVSILAVYGLITSNFSMDVGGGYIGNWYIGEFLPTLLTLIFLAGIGFLIAKFGLCKILIIIGLGLIVVSFTGLVYEGGILVVIGIVLLLIGVVVCWRRKRRPRPEREPRIPEERREREEEETRRTRAQEIQENYERLITQARQRQDLTPVQRRLLIRRLTSRARKEIQRTHIRNSGFWSRIFG